MEPLDTFPRRSALTAALGLALVLVACTAEPPVPPAQPSSGSAGGSTQVSPVPTAPSANLAPGPTTQATLEPIADGGNIRLSIQAADLPTGATCHGFAQNTGTVQSGGGALGGATVRLGTLSYAAENKLILPAGTYILSIRCLRGNESWEGTGSLITTRRNEDVLATINLTPVP